MCASLGCPPPAAPCGDYRRISLTLHSFRLLISTFVLLCAAGGGGWPHLKAFPPPTAPQPQGGVCVCASSCLLFRLWCHNQYNAYENVFCAIVLIFSLSLSLLFFFCLRFGSFVPFVYVPIRIYKNNVSIWHALCGTLICCVSITNILKYLSLTHQSRPKLGYIKVALLIGAHEI